MQARRHSSTSHRAQRLVFAAGWALLATLSLHAGSTQAALSPSGRATPLASASATELLAAQSLQQGHAQLQARQWSAAVSSFNSTLRSLDAISAAPDINTRLARALALSGLGQAHDKLRQRELAEQALAHAVQVSAGSSDIRLQRLWAQARFRQLMLRTTRTDAAGAQEVNDVLVDMQQHLEQTRDPVLRQWLAQALFGAAVHSLARKDYTGASERFDQLEAGFSPAESAAMQKLLATLPRLRAEIRNATAP